MALKAKALMEKFLSKQRPQHWMKVSQLEQHCEDNSKKLLDGHEIDGGQK